MPKEFQKLLQILLFVGLVVQLTGCFFRENDHRRHYDPPEHHDHDAGLDIRVRG